MDVAIYKDRCYVWTVQGSKTQVITQLEYQMCICVYEGKGKVLPVLY